MLFLILSELYRTKHEEENNLFILEYIIQCNDEIGCNTAYVRMI